MLSMYCKRVLRVGIRKSKLKRRERVFQKLGGKCEGCGVKQRLHLHHIKYAKDSARWVEGKPDPFNEREKEADEHPERFKLFCPKCHGDYHKEQRKKLPRTKPVALITCKICEWVYFPDEIKEHEASCDGKTPMDRIREKSFNF